MAALKAKQIPALARLPETIRGYGRIKEQSINNAAAEKPGWRRIWKTIASRSPRNNPEVNRSNSGHKGSPALMRWAQVEDTSGRTRSVRYSDLEIRRKPLKAY
jgi:hypothetical protein